MCYVVDFCYNNSNNSHKQLVQRHHMKIRKWIKKESVNTGAKVQNQHFWYLIHTGNKMGACWEAISVNDWRMLNNEILKKKKKNFDFPLNNSLETFSGKRGFGISNIVNIYLIDSIATDHIKKTSDPSLSFRNYVKIFVSQTTAEIKKLTL